jgi:hypothetical protein
VLLTKEEVWEGEYSELELDGIGDATITSFTPLLSSLPEEDCLVIRTKGKAILYTPPGMYL